MLGADEKKIARAHTGYTNTVTVGLFLPDARCVVSRPHHYRNGDSIMTTHEIRRLIVIGLFLTVSSLPGNANEMPDDTKRQSMHMVSIRGQTDQQAVQLPDGAGWHQYRKFVPVNAKIRTVRGTRQQDGACLLRHSGTMSPGEQPLQTDEVAHNSDTCESLYAEYRITVDEARSLEIAEDGEGQTSSTADSAGESRSDVQTLGTGQRDAYSRTWYEDPPGIDVTSVKNSVSWIYNYSCVTASTGGYKYSWYTPSGWSLLWLSLRNTAAYE